MDIGYQSGLFTATNGLRSATVRPCRARLQNRSPASSCDLGVQYPHVHRRLRAEYVGRALQQLRPPLRDWVRVNVILLRQFGQSSSRPSRSQRHFRLECRRDRLLIVPPYPRPPWPPSGRQSTHPRCSDFPSHPSGDQRICLDHVARFAQNILRKLRIVDGTRERKCSDHCRKHSNGFAPRILLDAPRE